MQTFVLTGCLLPPHLQPMPHLKLNVIDVAARQKEQDCSIHGINLYCGIQIETPPSIPAETGHRPERPGTGKRTTLNHEMPGCKLAIVHCCAGMLVVILCCCLATFVPWSVIFIYYFILLIDMWRAVLSHQGCPLLLAPVGTFFFFFLYGSLRVFIQSQNTIFFHVW